MRLSSRSYVDIEEEEILQSRLKHIIQVYNRCKKNKTEFLLEDVLKECAIGRYNNDTYIELYNRVLKDGKKANIDGVHLETYDYFRKNLVDTMIENGLNPADYGYERFCEKSD